MNGILTANQVAKILKAHINTVHKLLNTGQIKAFKLGSHWRIRQEDLESFIKGEGGEHGQHTKENLSESAGLVAPPSL